MADQPRVGDLVYYVLDDGKSQGQIRPAIIVRVWDQAGGMPLVNLQVFTDDANDILPPVSWRTSVQFAESPEPGRWCWAGLQPEVKTSR